MTSSRHNILLLSAGRRVTLARALGRVAGEQGARLFCADMQPKLSAACQDNINSVEFPRVGSVAYAKTLSNICRDYEIGLVVPTIDTELIQLASLRDSFQAQGTTIVVSSEEFVAVARDKRKTAKHFSALGIRSPKLYPTNSPRYPVIAKPYDGSLSRDVYVLRNEGDFTDRVRAIPNLMLAEYLDPAEHDEYTCDAYYDREEKLRCVVPRLRLEVRGGEVSKARTVRNEIVDLFETQLSVVRGARGCLTFQFFRNRETSELYLIEVNARFGGGFPLSLAAGADYPAWLFAEWVRGQSVDTYSSWEAELMMLRYDGEVFVPRVPANG